jgi:hypothetical protein
MNVFPAVCSDNFGNSSSAAFRNMQLEDDVSQSAVYRDGSSGIETFQSLFGREIAM